MGADDDADCAGHVWRLATVVLGDGSAGLERVCVVCGAVTYDEQPDSGGGESPQV